MRAGRTLGVGLALSAAAVAPSACSFDTASEKAQSVVIKPAAELLEGRVDDIPLESSDVGATVCSNVVSISECVDDAVLVEKTAGYRIVLAPNEIPEMAKLALAASEDESFYNIDEHFGINTRGIARAFVHNFVDTVENFEVTYTEGGSSLTMTDIDLRKGLDLDESILDKAKEASYALALEIALEKPCATDILGIDIERFDDENPMPDETYDRIRYCVKDQIAVDVLNRAYFGADAYGIGASADQTFDEQPLNLNDSELVALIAKMRSPSNTDMIGDGFNDAIQWHERYMQIVNAMYDDDDGPSALQKLGKEKILLERSELAADGEPLDELSEEELEELAREWADNKFQEFEEGFDFEGIDDDVFYKTVEHEPITGSDISGAEKIAAVHPAMRGLEEAAGHVDMTVDELAEAGYTVILTLDHEMQSIAADTIRDINDNPEGYQGAQVSMNANGDTLTMVGGTDWDELRVNLATGRVAEGGGRQLGSASKIASAAVGVQNGHTVAAMRTGDKIPVRESYTFEDAEGEGLHYEVKTGQGCKSVFGHDAPCEMTMDQLFGSSSNTGNGFILGETGIAPAYGAVDAIEIMQGLGSDIEAEPAASFAVGSVNDTVNGEATVAAGMFLNKGRAVQKPGLVSEIYNGAGALVYKRQYSEGGEQTVEPEVAIDVTQIFRASVEQPYGTAYGAFDTAPNTLAHKTGTAQNKSDVWSVGAVADNETGGVAFAYWIGFPHTNNRLPDGVTSYFASEFAGDYITLAGLGDDGAQLPSNSSN